MQSAAKHPPMRDPVAACSVCASIGHDLAQGIPRRLGMTDAGELRTAKHSLRRAVMQSAAKHPPGRDRVAACSIYASIGHDLAQGIPRRLGMTDAGELRTAKHSLRRAIMQCRTKNSLCCAVMQSAAKHPPGRDRVAACSIYASIGHDLAQGIPRRLGMTARRAAQHSGATCSHAERSEASPSEARRTGYSSQARNDKSWWF